jgi:hypothetical protein
LVEVEAKNSRSSARRLPFTSATMSGFTPHCRATNVAISVVMAISSDTAMPNAPASASEEPKPITAVSVAAARAQLTSGT